MEEVGSFFAEENHCNKSTERKNMHSSKAPTRSAPSPECKVPESVLLQEEKGNNLSDHYCRSTGLLLAQ